jgi:protocatechuate 3,4-dioxygenase beta subunit
MRVETPVSRVLAVALFVTISAGIVLSQPASAPMRGRVVDDATGQPVRGARVGGGGLLDTHTRTGPDGRFEVAMPTSGVLFVSKPGFAREELPQKPVAGEVLVRMVRAAALAVKVVDGSGEPVPYASVMRLCDSPRGGRSGGGGGVNALGETRVGQMHATNCEVGVDGVVGPFGDQIDAKAMAARGRLDLRMAQMGAVKVQLRAGQETSVVLSMDPDPPGAAERRRVGPTGTGSIRGRVRDPGGQPIPGARVGVIGTSSPPVRHYAITDSTGGYVLDKIPTGTFRLGAQKPGFVWQGIGPDGLPARTDVKLQPGESVVGVDLQLIRSGTIRGTVFDQYGEPTEDAIVQVVPVNRPATSAPPGLPLAGMTAPMTRIDDRGQYTAFGLPPGKYYVGARIGETDTLVYFPGRTTLADAIPIELAAGGDETVDLFTNMVQGSHLRGTVITSSGAPAPGGRALLAERVTRLPGTDRTALIGSDGTFEFTDLPSGEYDLSVVVSPAPFVIITGRSGQPVDAPRIPTTEYGLGVVSLDGSGTIVVRTAPGSSLKGTVTVEGARPGEVSPFNVKLAAVRGLRGGVGVKSDWSFEVEGLSAPTRFVASAPAGWWLKSFMVGDVNAADDVVPFGNRRNERTDVKVVLARAGRLSGRVVDERGTAVTSSTVVAFPADRDRWYEQSRYIQSVRVGAGGVFQIDVPPGSYRLAAVDKLDAPDANVLTTLEPSSTPAVTGATNVTLRLIRFVQ